MPQTIEPVTAPPSSSARFSRGPGAKLAIVLLVAGVMIALVLRHVHGVNGPRYWQWPWRRLSALPLYPLMALAGIPFIVAQVIYHRWRQTAWCVLLLMTATFAMEIAAISQQPMGLSRIGGIVASAANTSYYSAAEVLVTQRKAGVTASDWLTLYPDLLQFMQVHARFKPPGLVLFYLAVIDLFGPGLHGQVIGGLIVGLAATLTVAGTFGLIRIVGGDAEAAWCGASFMSLCPSLILFFPQFDQVYPAIACALVLLWHEALRRESVALAVTFGAVLALATFVSYIVLVVGLFLGAYTILYCGRTRLAGVSRAAQYAVTAVGTCCLLYAVLWFTTGFNPVTTFIVIGALQDKDQVHLARPFPLHMAWDLYDFAMGSGWISFILAGLLLFRPVRSFSPAAKRLIGLSFLQIIAMACTALLPGESARLWMVLYPMLMVPVAFELSRWSTRYRLVVFAALWLITTIVAQNMIFLNMAEGRN